MEIKFCLDGLGIIFWPCGFVFVDTGDLLQHRLHAIALGTCPDALLLLFCSGHLPRCGRRHERQCFHLYLFYEVISIFHLSFVATIRMRMATTAVENI